MEKVSILMAVYNAENYLEKSLGSLIRQSYSNIQVICVDDGSTDHSLDTLHRFSEGDSRIEVVHLEQNSGLAHARNVALQHATGEYIIMLDADDWYSDDAIEKAVCVFHEHPSTDCVLFKCVDICKKGDDYQIIPHIFEEFEVLSGYDACIKSLTWKIHGRYMTRSEMYSKYPYDETTRLNSDENTTRVHYYYSREVRSCEGIYYYLQNENSISQAPTIRIFDIPKANESLLSFFQSVDIKKEDFAFFMGNCWLRIIDTYYRYYKNKAHFSREDTQYGMRQLFEAWQNIPLSDVPLKYKLKPGYIPFRFHPFSIGFKLFLWQEYLYFGLKRLTHRL